MGGSFDGAATKTTATCFSSKHKGSKKIKEILDQGMRNKMNVKVLRKWLSGL